MSTTSSRKRRNHGAINQTHSKRQKLNETSNEHSDSIDQALTSYLKLATDYAAAGETAIALLLLQAGESCFHELSASIQWKNEISKLKPKKKRQSVIRKERAAQMRAAKERIKKDGSLSMDRLRNLRVELQNIRGRTRTEWENKLIVQFVAYNLSYHKMSMFDAKEHTRISCGADYNTVDKIWKYYIATGCVVVKDLRTAKPRTVEDIYDLNEESNGKIFKAVARFAYERTIKTKEGFHGTDLLWYLTEQGYELSPRAVTEILRELNFYWTDHDEYYGQSETDDAYKKRLKTVGLKISHALRLQRDGSTDGRNFLFGTQDESWGNENSNNNYGPIHKCDRCHDSKNPCFIAKEYRMMEENDGVVLKTKMNKGGKGRRLLFSHVLTSKGLLNGKVEDLDENLLDKIHVFEETGFSPSELQQRRRHIYNVDMKTCEDLDIVIPTAEFVMRCGKNKGDYHDNMDGMKYRKMIKNRVIPAQQSRFPNEQLILLMDQAKYHVARSGFLDVNKATKPTVLKWLLDHGCISLTMVRKQNREQDGQNVLVEKSVAFDLRALANMDKLPAAPKGPSKDELLYTAYQWALKYYPDDLRVDVEIAMNDAGHFVIFNIPNCPQYNASEFMNGHAKRNMREDFITGRGTTGLHEDLMKGINGGKRKKGYSFQKPVSSEMIKNWFRHCLDTLKADCNAIGLEGEVIDWWNPECGVSIFDKEVHSPLSPKRKKEMEDRFRIDMSSWPANNNNIQFVSV